MNDQHTRTELLSVLQTLAESLPDMRAGQIMAALGEVCADMHGRGLWDADDTELLEASWKFRSDMEATTAIVNGQLAAS